MKKTPICWVNGRYIAQPEARVSPFDSGFLYGDGVYDTLRVYGGRIHLLPDHLARLSAHLKELSIPFKGVAGLPILFSSLIRRNRIGNGVLRVQITRGPQLAPLPNPRFGKPTLLITLRPFDGYPETLYRGGVSVRIETTPAHWNRPKPKSTSHQINLLAKLRAVESSCFETLFEHEGRLLEGSMSNLFLVRGGLIFTPPPEGILSGVTRAEVIRLAPTLDFHVDERSFTVHDAFRANELFLTSTTLEVMPVRRLIAGKRSFRFSAFPVSTLLRNAYRRTLPS